MKMWRTASQRGWHSSLSNPFLPDMCVASPPRRAQRGPIRHGGVCGFGFGGGGSRFIDKAVSIADSGADAAPFEGGGLRAKVTVGERCETSAAS